MSSSNLLIIGFVWPEPKSSAAGSRMLQLIEQFQKQGYQITFACAANTSDNTYDLTQLGIQTQAIALNDDSFDSFITTLNPEVVLFDRFMIEEQYGWRVAEHLPDALRILDTEDFHGLRKARQQALKEGLSMTMTHLQNDTTKREIASVYRCDLSIMISEAEIDILTSQFNIDSSLLCYLPFLLEAINENTIERRPTFHERNHFITIGNFLHPPNYDAVVHLKKDIWPLIRKDLPKAELHIYGAYPSQRVMQLHKPSEGFLIKGFTVDVNEVMQQARVCLVPLRFGAGLKGKLVDAMQNGTPCVMSSIAAEGMFGAMPPNGFIETRVEDFAKKAMTLYNDADQWQDKQQLGFEVINQRFQKTFFEDDFSHRIKNLRAGLKEHRQKNFIGNLLQHQTLQSVKYLSKWIAEKNKS
jgi:glycosyltransferase involved in cell wall biosynthesis